MCAFIFHAHVLHKEIMLHVLHQHGVIVVVTFSHKHLVDRTVMLCGYSIEALPWSFPLVNCVVSKLCAFVLFFVVLVDFTVIFLFDTAL